MTAQCQHMERLESDAAARLDWLAGTRRTLRAAAAQFRVDVQARQHAVERDRQMTAFIASTAQTTMQWEAWRAQHTERTGLNELARNKLTSLRDLLLQCEAVSMGISAAEVNYPAVIRDQSPGGELDVAWLARRAADLPAAITAAAAELTALNSQLAFVAPMLAQLVLQCRDTVHAFASLRAELLPQLGPVAATDSTAGALVEAMHAFPDAVERCMSHVAPLHRQGDLVVDADALAVLLSSVAALDVQSLVTQRDDMDARLQALLDRPLSDADGDVVPAPVRQASRRQQRNVTAVGVWRRVRAKLEGREDGRRRSVADHVQCMIDSARSIDNLAAMFEGWTAWI